jgi:hypothetical protein
MSHACQMREAAAKGLPGEGPGGSFSPPLEGGPGGSPYKRYKNESDLLIEKLRSFKSRPGFDASDV